MPTRTKPHRERRAGPVARYEPLPLRSNTRYSAFLMSKALGWLALAAALSFVRCGGKAELDPAVSGGGATAAARETNGGAAGSAECDDGGIPEAGCGGEAGTQPSDP